MAEGEHPNCQAVEDFLSAFKLSCPICATQNIDGKPVKNAYMAAYFDNQRHVGFTVVSWDDGELLALLERRGERDMKLIGKISDALAYGREIAKVIEP